MMEGQCTNAPCGFKEDSFSEARSNCDHERMIGVSELVESSQNRYLLSERNFSRIALKIDLFFENC
jgi:hypothetical protein